MTQKQALALADFLVAQTKPKNKVIIPCHLRFDGWLSTASQLRKSIMSTFHEMERIKKTEHIQSLTILKLRISDPIIRILSTLISFCSNARSIKMELEYPSRESVQYEMMHNRATAANPINFNDDYDENNDIDNDDYNSLMVTEENVIKYMRLLFHTISYLPKLKILFIRFIDFPLTVYKDYISMCFDLKATNYKSLPSLKALTFPIDHNNIQVYVQTEYWSIFKHFVHEHKLSRFTLLLDADMDENTNLFLIQSTTSLFNQFCNVFIPTLLNRKYPLNTLGILAQSPMNVLSVDDINGNNKGMCYSLIAPFFDIKSIHLSTLNEFNLYLPNPVPLQDMLDLIRFISESNHKLIKFRLELPNDRRYNKTKQILGLMSKFVIKNKQLNELHLHLTKTVNNGGIKKLFRSVRNHPNLLVFEMSEIQINSITWNALIDILDATNNNLDGSKNKKCNTNLKVFAVHFKYQSWHKILANKKLNMTENDPLRIINALYQNQQYLYKQIIVFRQYMKEYYNMSHDIINIINSFIFNQTILKLKISGLPHNIKKKNIDCFNWFHQLMFNNVPIINQKKQNKYDNNEDIDDHHHQSIITKEQLLYHLNWDILRSHTVKRQLLFR